MHEGDEVPDFELPDQDGRPRRLSTLLADGPVVLFFYPAAMTGGCTKEACHFRDLAAESVYEYGGRAGVKSGAKLGAPGKRRTFVIGRDRKLIKEIASETKRDVHADEALKALA